MILSNYEPKHVFHHFEAISQIPRGSGNEKGVSDFIAAWAKDLGLTYVQDELHNLIIYKPGTPGYEVAPPVILQGHLDMVCEKNSDTVHDFLKDPIKLYVDGDYVRAKGTTLGADNGIAVALCMALLEADNLAHPPLEVVLTSDEEAGMTGAMHINPKLLKGRKMINLDSGSTGTYTAGSAAASTAEYTIPATWEAPDAHTLGYHLTVKGLHGGHSGGDIKKERGNANRILGIVLNEIHKVADIRIASVGGGMKVNAIPRESWANIAIIPADKTAVQNAVDSAKATLGAFFRVADPGLTIVLEPAKPESKLLSAACGKTLIDSLILLPNGVQCMSRDIEGLVAASCNIGVMETFADGVKISCMARGASKEYTAQVEDKIIALAGLTGVGLEVQDRSPAWAFNPDSPIMKLFVAHHESVYGETPNVTAMHGGLECGIFAEKLPGLDIVACGPAMHDLHTPEERLSISSTENMYKFLCGVLAKMK